MPLSSAASAPSSGTIQPGKLADLIVVDDDPLQDITNLRRLRLVFKEGRLVSDRRAKAP